MIPGVEGVGVTNVLPIQPSFLSGSFEIEGRGPASGYSDYRVASGGYFRSLGIPLSRGRFFTNDDRADQADVAIVNQALADRYWPGESAIGKRIRNLANDSFRYGAERWLTVVGVVGNVRLGALNGRIEPTVFVDYAQRPFRTRYASVVVRTTVPPERVAGAVRSRLREIGSNVPAKLITMESRIGDSVAARLFLMSVLGFFAQVALILAGVGIYGVVSYQVAQRTREIGVRLALGAGTHRVLKHVFQKGLVLIMLGLGVGVPAALALTRVLSSLLFGVSASDPLTFAAVILLLVAVALLAIYIPARRATRVDPLVAMRAE
jgi:predicted permease